MTVILGINAYHGDASAAILAGGELLAAVEEERFTRVKHWAGLPIQSIQSCLQQAGLEIQQVDHIALSFNPKANFCRKLAFLAIHRPSLKSILERIQRQRKTLALGQQLARMLGADATSVRAKLHRIEHHQSHIAAGFLASPFDESAVLSVDGMGDFTSTLTAHATGADWTELDRVTFPNSIGFLYSAITMLLGFPNYGDEYKVMGLAAFGQPEYAEAIRQMIRPSGSGFTLNLKFFTHHRRGIRMQWQSGSPTIEPFHSQRMIDELGPARDTDNEPLARRHENIASSLQLVTEEILLHVLRGLWEKSRSEMTIMTSLVIRH